MIVLWRRERTLLNQSPREVYTAITEGSLYSSVHEIVVFDGQTQAHTMTPNGVVLVNFLACDYQPRSPVVASISRVVYLVYGWSLAYGRLPPQFIKPIQTDEAHAIPPPRYTPLHFSRLHGIGSLFHTGIQPNESKGLAMW
jgi:hypothetical protein